MLYTALTTIFTCFAVFRATFNHESNGAIANTITLIWSWYYVIFLIACIHTADAMTKSVSFPKENKTFFMITLLHGTFMFSQANDAVKITSRIMNNSHDEALLDKVCVAIMTFIAAAASKHFPTFSINIPFLMLKQFVVQNKSRKLKFYYIYSFQSSHSSLSIDHLLYLAACLQLTGHWLFRLV